jgi:hypothetical protein
MIRDRTSPHRRLHLSGLSPCVVTLAARRLQVQEGDGADLTGEYVELLRRAMLAGRARDDD